MRHDALARFHAIQSSTSALAIHSIAHDDRSAGAANPQRHVPRVRQLSISRSIASAT